MLTALLPAKPNQASKRQTLANIFALRRASSALWQCISQHATRCSSLLLIFVFFWNSNLSYAHTEAIDLANPGTTQQVLQKLAIFDASNTLDWPQISSPQNQYHFHPLKEDDLFLSDDITRYWLRFGIRNSDSKNHQRFLYIAPNNLRKLQLYCDEYEIPRLAANRFRNPSHLFELNLAPGEQRDCFLQFDNHHRHILSVDFYSSDALVVHTATTPHPYAPVF